jgi:cytochrome c
VTLQGAGFAGAVALCAAAPVAADGDAARGEQAYGRCLGCHALAYDRVGPRHCGLLGRPAGSVPSFEYSVAMKKSRITWDEKTLERFLANPLKAVPGTTMTYDGVPNLQDRLNLIAYLKRANRSAECAQ